MAREARRPWTASQRRRMRPFRARAPRRRRVRVEIVCPCGCPFWYPMARPPIGRLVRRWYEPVGGGSIRATRPELPPVSDHAVVLEKFDQIQSAGEFSGVAAIADGAGCERGSVCAETSSPRRWKRSFCCGIRLCLRHSLSFGMFASQPILTLAPNGMMLLTEQSPVAQSSHCYIAIIRCCRIDRLPKQYAESLES